MVAYADIPVNLKEAKLEREALRKTSAIRLALLTCAGTALLGAAGGLWLVPGGVHDPVMQLIKLLLSVVLGMAGLFLFSLIERSSNEPEIRIDLAKREVCLLHYDDNGAVTTRKSYHLDEFSEVQLQDNALTARDFTGKQVVAVPVYDRATRRALRAALEMAA